MPQRTITDADQALAALTETLPARSVEALRSELENARLAAQDIATKAHDERYAAAGDLSDELRDHLNELCGDLRRLTERARLAETPAKRVAAELQSLRQQQRTYRRQADDVARAVEHLRTIEADPVAWVDNALYAKFPLIRPQFTF